MVRDDLFRHTTTFQFDSDVAHVFDDMVSRSVPIYDEVHKIVRDMVRRYFPPCGTIYDLGTSTGTTLVHLHKELQKRQKKAHIIGVDDSESMLEKCRQKLKDHQITGVELLKEDLTTLRLRVCDLVIMNYTLQFLPLSKRPSLLKNIHAKLNPGGIFFLSEKVKSSDKKIDEMLICLYQDFKRRNHYSQLEISRKREALENVLVPLTSEEQTEMLIRAGFQSAQLIFRWYNFASYMGIK